MTVTEILIVVFGLPTLTLLAGIYHKMGSFEATVAALKEKQKDMTSEMRSLWSELNKVKEKIT